MCYRLVSLPDIRIVNSEKDRVCLFTFQEPTTAHTEAQWSEDGKHLAGISFPYERINFIVETCKYDYFSYQISLTVSHSGRRAQKHAQSPRLFRRVRISGHGSGRTKGYTLRVHDHDQSLGDQDEQSPHCRDHERPAAEIQKELPVGRLFPRIDQEILEASPSYFATRRAASGQKPAWRRSDRADSVYVTTQKQGSQTPPDRDLQMDIIERAVFLPHFCPTF